MAYSPGSKVVIGGQTIIDLTADTVSASKMLAGTTAHDKTGASIAGSIATKTSDNVSVSGNKVTVPAGYYGSQVQKSVSSGSTTQKTPTIDTATGKITATATVTAGYQNAGTKSNTLQLTVQAAKTLTPSRSEQVAVAKNRYTTGAVKVAAIPSTYYTMAEAIALLYPVGSVWATDDSTANPATVLGLGTWSKVAPNEPRWDDLTSTWNTITGAMGGYYVWKRLS